MSYLFKDIVEKIIENNDTHAKLLNSLSLMENVGARKISRYQDPVFTNIIVLKHAAEEARHAFYLKKQIQKLGENICPDYSSQYLLASISSTQYLMRLDISACRYLKKIGLSGRELYNAAYILVTYAIEVRADVLYDIYQTALTKADSKVNVKSIILEEAGHLEEMTKMLEAFDPNWKNIANDICKMEEELHKAWLQELEDSIVQ